MPHVIIIRGPAGVGKTTVARMLAERIHGVYLSIDERIDAMQVQGEEEGGIPRKYFLAAQDDCLPTAQQALEAGTSVVLDGNFYWPEQFTHLAAHLPYPQRVVTLMAPLSTCLARDAVRTTRAPIGELIIRAVYDLSSRISVGEEMETEGKTADAVVRDILVRLG